MAVLVGADEEGLRPSVACIHEGGVLLYPTETVYGLGGDARDGDVAERILALKGSASDKPMLALTDGWERVQTWFADIPAPLQRLMDHRPVLPITFLVPAAKGVPAHLVGADGLVGVRRTNEPFCLSLIAESGAPLLSTSANRTGEKPPSQFDEIDPEIVNGVDVAVNAGRPLQGSPSTIVRAGDDSVTIDREGAVSAATIHEIIGKG